MEVESFRLVRRARVVLSAMAAVAQAAAAAMSFVAGQLVVLTVMLALAAITSGSLALVLWRQYVLLTDDEIVAVQGFQRQQVAWDDVEVVHLDWVAESGGDGRDVLRIERRDADTVRSSAAMGMGMSSDGVGERLEAALRRRAEIHGFAVQVNRPRWMSGQATDTAG